MIKKLTYAVTISALAALSLATVIAASGGSYPNFTIANGDPNEEGVNGQTKVQPAVVIPQAMSMLNILAGDDNDKSGPVLDYTNFTIANGDENEEGQTE
jgi:hypothetical protein